MQDKIHQHVDCSWLLLPTSLQSHCWGEYIQFRKFCAYFSLTRFEFPADSFLPQLASLPFFALSFLHGPCDYLQNARRIIKKYTHQLIVRRQSLYICQQILVSLFFILSLMSKWIRKLDDWLNNKETLTPLPEKDVFQLCNLVSIVASSSFLG